MFLCALVVPLFPPLPAPCLSMCPSCVSACPAVVFFCFCSVFALPAAPARPACAICSSLCWPCPAALRPLSRLSPLPFSFSLWTLPVRLPSLSVPRCHSCVPSACSTPAPPPRPYPFPWGLPHPSAPSVPASQPILVAWHPVWGGVGVYLWTGLWPCPRSGMAAGCLLTMSHRMCRMNTERTPGRRLSNSRRCICTVEPSHIDKVRTPLHLAGPMAPVATKAWRVQPLREGRT